MNHPWIEHFPRLSPLDAASRRLLLEATQPVSLPAGAPAFRAGSACEHYLLVVSGSVRVQQLADSGREIVLYRVHGGETCVLTTACLLAHERYSAEAIPTPRSRPSRYPSARLIA